MKDKNAKCKNFSFNFSLMQSYFGTTHTREFERLLSLFDEIVSRYFLVGFDLLIKNISENRSY